MSARKTLVQPPISCRFYLADDARSEVGGKTSLLGLYVDDIVVIEMRPEEAEPTIDEPIAIEGLTILCALHGFKGAADFELALLDQQRRGLGRTLTIESTEPNAITLVSRFRPLLIHSFGKITFSITCTALRFRQEFEFSVVRRDAGTHTPKVRVSLKPVQQAVAPLKAPTERPRRAAAAKTPVTKKLAPR